MSEPYILRDYPIVAASTPPTSKSPFNKGAPIVMVDDVYVRVEKWLEHPIEPRFSGTAYAPRDYEALVGAGHFLPLPTTKQLAVADTMIWVLRPNHPRFEAATLDILKEGWHCNEFLPGPEGSRIFVVVGGRPILTSWYYLSIGKAEAHIAASNMEAAEMEAYLAFATSPTLDHNTIGMLAAIYEAQRRQQRADGMLVMSLRSRGPEFERKVIETRDVYRSVIGYAARRNEASL